VLNPADGKRLWYAHPGSAAIAAGVVPVWLGNGLVIAEVDNGFAVLNASDGTVRWNHPIPDLTGRIEFMNGVLYGFSHTLSSPAGEVTAIRASDGTVIWRHQAT
jgi:outer membrane protein assembly factor BamB